MKRESRVLVHPRWHHITFKLGVRTGYPTPGFLWMRAITSVESPICGTHFFETNAVASMVWRPVSESLCVTSVILHGGVMHDASRRSLIQIMLFGSGRQVCFTKKVTSAATTSCGPVLTV
jgi:hypothetical protein